jgi:DNA-binding NtrC family response regulator
MNEIISVLIVEDEKVIADAIKEGFDRSTKYQFDTEIALIRVDLKELIGYAKKNYDIYIVDLRLKPTEITGKDYSGFKVIQRINPFLIQKRFDLQGMIIVYSAYSGIENVVKAMKLGASDFIDKSKCPHHLVEQIEKILDERKQKIEINKKINEILENQGKLWHKKYADESIIIVDDKVVAHGKTHLETLIQYDNLRKEHPDWPEEPIILYIAKEEEQ